MNKRPETCYIYPESENIFHNSRLISLRLQARLNIQEKSARLTGKAKKTTNYKQERSNR